MDPASKVRLRVIHAFSENDPERAVRFSLESLAQQEPDLSLLALDMLDCNIAYLEPGIELTLERFLHHKQERLRVKSARLLVLLSHYFDFTYDQPLVINIIESALESSDVYCRQMAYGMPASVFYKMKTVKSTLAHLKTELEQRNGQIAELKEELQSLKVLFRSRQQQERSYAHIVDNVEAANARLREQMHNYEQAFTQRDTEIREVRQQQQKDAHDRDALLNNLIKERKARATEVEHARELYENLVNDYHARESEFKHQVHEFYERFRGVFKTLIEEKEDLLDELYRSGEQSSDKQGSEEHSGEV